MSNYKGLSGLETGVQQFGDRLSQCPGAKQEILRRGLCLAALGFVGVSDPHQTLPFLVFHVFSWPLHRDLHAQEVGGSLWQEFIGIVPSVGSWQVQWIMWDLGPWLR